MAMFVPLPKELPSFFIKFLSLSSVNGVCMLRWSRSSTRMRVTCVKMVTYCAASLAFNTMSSLANSFFANSALVPDPFLILLNFPSPLPLHPPKKTTHTNTQTHKKTHTHIHKHTYSTSDARILIKRGRLSPSHGTLLFYGPIAPQLS